MATIFMCNCESKCKICHFFIPHCTKTDNLVLKHSRNKRTNANETISTSCVALCLVNAHMRLSKACSHGKRLHLFSQSVIDCTTRCFKCGFFIMSLGKQNDDDGGRHLSRHLADVDNQLDADHTSVAPKKLRFSPGNIIYCTDITTFQKSCVALVVLTSKSLQQRSGSPSCSKWSSPSQCHGGSDDGTLAVNSESKTPNCSPACCCRSP